MYRSEYEAYPFLSEDKTKSVACDFEIMSDEVVSKIGYLASMIEEKNLNDELRFIAETLYHLNPTLRTFLSVSEDEFCRIKEAAKKLKEQTKGRCEMFVLPYGSGPATFSHIIRNNFKALSRLAYDQERLGNPVPSLLHDILGIMSNYFFYLSLFLNMQEGIEEIPYISRNYKITKS